MVPSSPISLGYTDCTRYCALLIGLLAAKQTSLPLSDKSLIYYSTNCIAAGSSYYSFYCRTSQSLVSFRMHLQKFYVVQMSPDDIPIDLQFDVQPWWEGMEVMFSIETSNEHSRRLVYLAPADPAQYVLVASPSNSIARFGLVVSTFIGERSCWTMTSCRLEWLLDNGWPPPYYLSRSFLVPESLLPSKTWAQDVAEKNLKM